MKRERKTNGQSTKPRHRTRIRKKKKRIDGVGDVCTTMSMMTVNGSR